MKGLLILLIIAYALFAGALFGFTVWNARELLMEKIDGKGPKESRCDDGHRELGSMFLLPAHLG